MSTKAPNNNNAGFVTYDVLQPDLVETVERQTLDIGDGGLGFGSSSRRSDLGEGRLRGGSDLGTRQNGSGQQGRDSTLHRGESIEKLVTRLKIKDGCWVQTTSE
jgi:hypothetical protein